jgi:hypothetical protein
MMLTLGTASIAGAAELRPAKLLEAESYTERQTAGAVRHGNGAIYSLNHDMNRITVSLDGMKITGVFESHWSWSSKASNLVVGTEVMAMVDKGKLIVVTPDVKKIKAKIVRRELESTPSGAGNGEKATSNSSASPASEKLHAFAK